MIKLNSVDLERMRDRWNAWSGGLEGFVVNEIETALKGYTEKDGSVTCACGQPHTITIESSEKNAASILIKDYIARVRQPICNLILSVGSSVTKDALVDALAKMDDTPVVRPPDPTWIHKPGCPTPYQWGVIEFSKKGWVCRDLAGKPQLKKAALYCDGCGDAKPKNPEVV